VELTMSDDAGDEDELLAQIAGGDMRALEALYRARETVSGMSGHSAAAPAGEPDGIRLDVVNALLQLAEVERQIVVLHDMAGLTHAEVAAELELPAGTVRWRYRVALARLRPLVQEEAS
jgi:DNA-directed RNA polymerase specialized sigma24 family protein